MSPSLALKWLKRADFLRDGEGSRSQPVSLQSSLDNPALPACSSSLLQLIGSAETPAQALVRAVDDTHAHAHTCAGPPSHLLRCGTGAPCFRSPSSQLRTGLVSLKLLSFPSVACFVTMWALAAAYLHTTTRCLHLFSKSASSVTAIRLRRSSADTWRRRPGTATGGRTGHVRNGDQNLCKQFNNKIP